MEVFMKFLVEISSNTCELLNGSVMAEDIKNILASKLVPLTPRPLIKVFYIPEPKTKHENARPSVE